MRGDFHSRTNCEQTVQRDSSSGSSSPHSNPDDDVIEVNSAEFMPKPIYNFSIPDVIIHEHRVERENRRVEREHRHRGNHDRSLITGTRKRTYPSRHNNNIIDESDISNNISNDNNNGTNVNTNVKRRKRANAEVIEDSDADCHRESVVIDLTDIDSHDDDYQNAHSDSEVNRSSRAETRPLRHFNPSGSFRECLSDLQRFHQRLRESSEYFGLHRLRRRRPVITDGPVVNLNQTSSPDLVESATPNIASADDSVTFVNEVYNSARPANDDHDIALRMLQDPNYSPPYHSPPRSTHQASVRNPARVIQTDESLREFQERVRAFGLRSRERFERARRISIQARERLARIHESLYDLQRLSPTIENRSTTTDRRSNRSSNRANGETESNRASDGTTRLSNHPAESSEESDAIFDDDNINNEVEFIREWNPRDLDSLNTIIHHPFRASFQSLNDAENRNPLPDFFMDTLLGSPLQQEPRLHHLQMQNLQNYEALLHLADRLGPAKQRGLTKTELDQVPSFRFSKETSKTTNTKCVICMSEYANREKLRRLTCTHDFHSKCIDKWLKSNITCPICRDEVNPSKDSDTNNNKQDV